MVEVTKANMPQRVEAQIVPDRVTMELDDLVAMMKERGVEINMPMYGPGRGAYKGSTEATKRIMLNRLAEVFTPPEMRKLSWQHYPIIAEKLGWKESTFATALKYMGRDPGQLRNPRRTYIPKKHEIQALARALDANMILTLTLTGCRFGELWRMSINHNELTIYTLKGGDKVYIGLDDMDRQYVDAITLWVEVGSKKISYDAARKAWKRCVDASQNGPAFHRISLECTPHTFRHRAATLYEASGMDCGRIAERMGWKGETTARRYKHSRNSSEVVNVLAPI